MNEKSPGGFLRGFVISGCSLDQVRVRIRIMKVSKESSATCIQTRDSLRKPDRLEYILPKCGLLLERSA